MNRNYVEKSRSRFRAKFKSDYIYGYAFVALPLIGFALFGLVPLVLSLYYSFTSYNMFSPPVFSGFANYGELFRDPIFGQSLVNIAIALLGVPLTMLCALGVAYMLTRSVRLVSLFRTMFFIPGLCSVVATTIVWRMIFNYNYGFLNSVLSVFNIPPVYWLMDGNVVMISMIIHGIWGGIGSGMVMYIAAIKNVPSQLYDAAKIDGANSVRVFWKITFPNISPTTFYIFITSTMGTLQDFTRYRIMTDGMPEFKSMTPVLYIYKYVFGGMGGDNSFGYASAMAWIVGIIVIAITLFNFGMSKKWVSYDT